MDRRHFLIRMSGLVATFVVLGAEVTEVLRVAGGPAVAPVTKAPIPFPNAGSPVKPVPGTRPEYTPVAEHYRVDIDLSPPTIDASAWRLAISGLVARPLQLTIDQLRTQFRARHQFITLECISNPVGGPLIGTTLWSGPSFRDVLATAQPQPTARYAHVLAEDGFEESVSLEKIQSDPRVHPGLRLERRAAPDRARLPPAGLRARPLRHEAAQVDHRHRPRARLRPRLLGRSAAGTSDAIRRTTSVIDTVGDERPAASRRQTHVPVGGIADAGARGISKVEVQVDDGPWERGRAAPAARAS